MNISGLFSGFANNLLQHYQQLINDIKSNSTPRHYYQSSPDNTIPGQVSDTNVPLTEDYYNPSSIPISTANTSDVAQAQSSDVADDADDSSVPVNSDTYIPSGKEASNSDEAANNIMPDGTYNFKSSSQLNYKLDLSFDLAAISRTVRYLSEGDVTQVEQLTAAGFGLSADFALTGQQIVKAAYENGEASNSLTDHLKGRNVSHMNQAGAFMANSRDFKVQSFYKEASSIKNSFDVKNNNGYSRVVNKLAMRYSLDSSFSFANLERFNVQTKQIADQTPQSLEDYFSNTGNLADTGSNELMATFFDAVDSYLDQTESNLLDKTVAFFEQAASELGFSEPMIAIAKNHLVSTIEGFFDRVDQAINKLESVYAPEQIETETGIVYLPVDDQINPDAGKAETTQNMAIA